MGGFADFLSTGGDVVPEPIDDSPGQFRQGLRSGLSGAESQLQSFAGGAAEALGADAFARGRYEAARAAQAEAQANAPRVTSYKDVGDLRSGFDYVTGLLGQSVPQSAAMVAGGMAGRMPLGRVVGASAAGTPFEAGDIIQRQQNDDPAQMAPAGERARDALLGGAASATAQSIIPAAVAGRIAAPARAGVAQTLRSGLRETPRAMLVEGVGETAGEGIKQFAADQDMDVEALKEAFIGGAAAGGGMHSVGVTAETAKAAASPGSTLSGVAGRARDAVASGVQALRGETAGEAAQAAGGAPAGTQADPVDTIRGIYDQGAQQARQFWDRIAAREDVADLRAVAGQTAEQLKAKLPELDSRRVEEVTKAAHDLMNRAGLDEVRRGQLQQAMADLTDRGNQAVVVSLRRSMDATTDFAGKARGLLEEFKGKPADDSSGAKKSEDFSGVRQAIAQELVPVLQRTNPDIFTDGEALGQAADGVRLAIEHFRDSGKEQLTSNQIARLIDTFGDQTVNVLESVHRAMGQVSTEESERFYGALNELRARQRDQDQTLGLMMRSLLPELQDTVKTSDLRRELAALRAWAQRPVRNTEQDRFKTESLKFELDTRYGKNADKILDAVEKESRQQENALAREDTDQLGERELAALGDSVFYGPEKGGLAMNPDLDPAGDKGQARQAMARAAKQNPDRTVRFLSADELGHDHPDVQTKLKELQQQFMDAGKSAKEAARLAKEAVRNYGMVAAEGQSEPGTITKDNIKQVRVKDGDDKAKTSHYRQASVFKVDNAAYDAIALTKLIEKQFKGEFNEADDRAAVNRRARMFMTGVAALQDHLGKTFSLPDTLVIDHQGTTVADIKKLDLTPQTKGEGGERASASELQNQLRSLRNQYLGLRRKAAALDEDTDEGASELEVLEGEMESVLEKAEATKARLGRIEREERLQQLLEETGRYEADPKGPIHEQGDKPEPIRTNETGNSREKDQGLGGALPTDPEVATKSGPVKGTSDVLRDKFEAWATNPPSAAAKVIGERGVKLLDNKELLNNSAKKDLAALLSKGKKPSDVASTVNALWEKYGARVEGETKDTPAEIVSTAFKQADDFARGAATKAAKAPEPFKPDPLDKVFAKESYPELKTRADVDAFLLQAYRRWGQLAQEERRVMNDDNHPTNDLEPEQRDAYYKMAELFSGDSHADLGSFDPGNFDSSGDRNAEIRAMLRRAAPEVAGQVPSYFRSQQKVGTHKGIDSKDLAEIRAYVDKVLGPAIKTSLANIPHAGEMVNDTIRISIYALNPRSVARHEAWHAFMVKLLDQNNGEVARVVEKAAMSAPIQNQLRKLLAGESAALAQLRDPEEAAAYMYQFWAAGQLKIGDGTKNVFTRIRDAIAKVLGILTNDARAQMVLEYFDSGEFQRSGQGRPNVVAKVLLQSGRNRAIDRARQLTKPLIEAADALATAGGQRLRDTGIPALRDLADAMKVTGRETAGDSGFIQAARTERARVMNEFGAKMRGFTQAHLEDALEAMQAGTRAQTPEGRLVQRAVQGQDGLLPTMLKYMKGSGVDVAKIQPRPDYFPRLYDAAYISRHQDEFQEVLERHGIAATEARRITLNLMATNGAEFTVETDRPGMQNLKTRRLAMIPDAELAPFMRKNLFEILGSYVTQATRRAEWARRFGDDGVGIARLLQKAKTQGATPEQLETARKYVRAVDGTLGDDLSPGARRVMGNVVVYQNLRLLPLAIFSSVVDPLGIVVRGGTVSDAWSTFKRGVREVPGAFRNAYKTDAETQLAASLGVIDDAMLESMVGHLYTQGMVGDTARKINDAFFRFNLMEGFNRSMRVGATQAAIRFLERHRDGKASDHSVRWLAELGLQPGFKMDLADPKVRAAVNLWVDGAVLRPDAADKPIWMSDPHYMLFAHLKQFVFAFQETILKRVAHEYANGNYAPAMALTSYVPVMIASDLIKGLIQGGGELPEWKKHWGPGDYLESGIERAGLLGKLQFPLDGPGMLLGPTAQQAYKVVGAIDGRADAGSTAMRALPGGTLFSGWLRGSGEALETVPAR